MSDQQKVILLTKQTTDDCHKHLELSTKPICQPGEGQCCIKYSCRPINPADIFCLQGSYPSFPQVADKGHPLVPGLEGVGKIHKNGPGCSKFKEGQRVVPAPAGTLKDGNGSWQQYVCVKESCLLAVPDSMSDETASQFWVNPCTVRGLLDTAAVPKGGWLIQGAAGSVLGRQLIQMAKHFGLKTINLVRRHEQVQELLDLGGDVALCTEGDWQAEVLKVTESKGAYAALDPIAGPMTGQLLSVVRPGGTVLVYGAMSGYHFDADVTDVLFRRKMVGGFVLGPWAEDLGPKRKQEMYEEVMGMLADGTIKPYSGKSYSLEQVAEAVQEAQQPGRGGKVFLKG